MPTASGKSIAAKRMDF